MYISIALSCVQSHTLATPQGPSHLFPADQPGAVFDPDLDSLVHTDDEGNLYFDVYALKGPENKFMCK